MSNTFKKEIYHLPKEMFFCRPSAWLGEFLSSGWDINIAEMWPPSHLRSILSERGEFSLTPYPNSIFFALAGDLSPHLCWANILVRL